MNEEDFDELKMKVRDIHTYLLGINGQSGFCKRTEERLNEVETKSSRNTKLIIFVLGSLGIGTGTIVGIV